MSAVLAGATSGLTRQNLLDQRESAATARTYQNAARSKVQLPDGRADERPATDPTERAGVAADADRLEPGARARTGEWYARGARVRRGRAARPSCATRCVGGPAGPHALRPRGRRRSWPSACRSTSVDGAYFEIVSLGELEETLESISISLLGRGPARPRWPARRSGWWAARRVLRPLRGIGDAAHAIATGRLDTRVEASDDADLAHAGRLVQRDGRSPSRSGSSATPGSRPTSATSCARRS